jgi:hypothetical protein
VAPPPQHANGSSHSYSPLIWDHHEVSGSNEGLCHKVMAVEVHGKFQQVTCQSSCFLSLLLLLNQILLDLEMMNLGFLHHQTMLNTAVCAHYKQKIRSSALLYINTTFFN